MITQQGCKYKNLLLQHIILEFFLYYSLARKDELLMWITWMNIKQDNDQRDVYECMREHWKDDCKG